MFQIYIILSFFVCVTFIVFIVVVAPSTKTNESANCTNRTWANNVSKNDFAIFNTNATHSNTYTHKTHKIHAYRCNLIVPTMLESYRTTVMNGIRVRYDDELYMFCYALDNVHWKFTANQIKTIFAHWTYRRAGEKWNGSHFEAFLFLIFLFTFWWFVTFFIILFFLFFHFGLTTKKKK